MERGASVTAAVIPNMLRHEEAQASHNKSIQPWAQTILLETDMYAET